MTNQPRTYERTHPWLKFVLDARSTPFDTWILLGECQSKCEHIAGTPLQPEVSQMLHRVYLAKGVAATTAIEGNTLSEEQVAEQIQGTLSVPPSKEYLKQEVKNVLDGCNLILKEIASGTVPRLTADRIKQFNRIVLDGLKLADEDTVPGEVRHHSVGVMDYRGAPAEDCNYLLDRLCEWLNGWKPEGNSILWAIIKAVVAHIYLAWIHPFGDGNGRTARLVEVQILMCSGIPSASAQLLCNHYNQTRSEYYRQLQQSSKSGGDLMPFLKYAIQGLRDGLKEQIDTIRAQHIDVAWINYVHGSFKGLDGAADDRRKKLVLELSAQQDWVTFDAITKLSTKLALAYMGKAVKTLTRDLEKLEQMRLIVFNRRDRKIAANKSIILAFMPTKVNAETRPLV